MADIKINYKSTKGIAFTITDTVNNALLTKRVTAAFAAYPGGGPFLLKKQSALPGPSADVFIASQTASSIVGTVAMTEADFGTLVPGQYAFSLWTDDGASVSECVTAGGADRLVVQLTAPRT